MLGYSCAKVGTFIKDAQCVRLTTPLSSLWSKLDTFNMMNRVLLAGNQTQQDTLDGIKLGGVDEWVGADVEK